MIKDMDQTEWIFLILILLVALLALAIFDVMGSTGTIYPAKVVERTFIKPTTIPVIDTCTEDPSPQCYYQPGRSTTRYGLAVDVMGEIEIYPVPKSYFYSVDENHHIPVHKKQGLLTGIVYANNVDFVTQ